MNQKILFYYQCMDKMLEQLTKEPKAELFSPPDLAKKCGLDLTDPVAHLLCNKMVKENHLERFPESKFCLSEDSIFFIEEGGYAEKYKRDLLISDILRNEKETMKKNERRLILWTAAVAVGAIGLVLWEMYKTFCLKIH